MVLESEQNINNAKKKPEKIHILTAFFRLFIGIAWCSSYEEDHACTYVYIL